MFKIDGPGIVPAKPARTALGVVGWFNQTPGASPGTVVTAEWLNMIQGEFLSVLNAAGIVPDKSDDAQLLAAIQALVAPQVPPGTIFEYSGNLLPAGFLWAAGQLELIADYPNLFAATGTTYGGDGITTFGVIDKRDRIGIGRGNMGGVAAGRITNGVSGINTNVLGAAGGLEQSNAPLSGTVEISGTTDPEPDVINVDGSGGLQAAAHPHAHPFTGSGPIDGVAAANRIQPGIVVNFIVKT
jgi:microcystin-dependent protein